MARLWQLGAAVVLGLGGCLGAVLYVGKVVDDAEPARPIENPGHAAAVEATRERARMFQSMNPAQHLAAAREAMRDYDPRLRAGGNYGLAEAHLLRIPEGAPEHPEAALLRATIADARTHNLEYQAATLARRFTARGATLEDRRALVRHLDTRTDLACVHALDPDATVVGFANTDCSDAWLSAFQAPEPRGVFRAVGVRRVTCEANPTRGFSP
ncbi:MAG: hypothetical protein HY909_06955 [Deltaproteobacteria bacterium]|nr:hypothetical protein [Deltaproteobacteria bacterium]